MTDNRTTELLPCPFCGGEAEVIEADYGMYLTGYAIYCRKCCLKLGVTGRLGEAYEWSPVFNTEAEAIAAWNARAELGSEPPYDELLRCLENDWHIRASWDGLRKFWCVELTEEGVKLRDAARAERTCEPNWVLQFETQTQEFWRCECGNCGECFGVEDRSSFPFKVTIDKVDIPKYCPNCGCKVVDE